MRTRLTLGGLTLFGLVMAACTSAITSPNTTVDIEAALTDLNRLSWPSSYENAGLINSAHARVFYECMVAKGWDKTLQPSIEPADQIALANTLDRDDAWTFDDRAKAESVGYGISHLAQVGSATMQEDMQKDPYDPRRMPPEEVVRHDLDAFGSESERVAILDHTGREVMTVPGGGCFGEANEQLWGDRAGEERLRRAAADLLNLVWGDIVTDGDLRRSLRNWRDCMELLGYDVEDPQQAIQSAFDIYERSSMADALQDEIDIATADVDCKAQTGLVQAFATAARNALDGRYHQFEAGIVAYQEAVDMATANAKAILGLSA